MLSKVNNIQRIVDTGIIAVIRAESKEKALKITEAVKQGGVDIIEITLTVPGAIDVIKEIKKNYSDQEVLLGAGTVLDPETARAAMLAGAEYLVSPNFNPDVVKICNRYQKLSMPGCMTVTEIINALEAGADIIKIFPGSAFGPSVVKAIKGPVPQAEFIPTGGVNINNVQEWIKNGCLAVGVGSELTIGVKSDNYKLVTETAKRFKEAISNVK